jgi:hypothetical protein
VDETPVEEPGADSAPVLARSKAPQVQTAQEIEHVAADSADRAELRPVLRVRVVLDDLEREEYEIEGQDE